MLITKLRKRGVKYAWWVVLSNNSDGTVTSVRSVHKHGMGGYKGLRIKTGSLNRGTTHETYRLNEEDVHIINQAFELLEPIMEGVTDMPSLEIWRKLNG